VLFIIADTGKLCPSLASVQGDFCFKGKKISFGKKKGKILFFYFFYKENISSFEKKLTPSRTARRTRISSHSGE